MSENRLRGLVRELVEEFRAVFVGRSNLIDSVIPPVVFLVVNGLAGFDTATGSALILALLITGVRFARGQSLRYALGGLGGVGLAVLVARLLNSAEGFFLPPIIGGIATMLLCGGSIIVRRPLVAWTSHFTRRWPRDWYWHPQVRPAYTEVTAVWLLFFSAKLALQLFFFTSGQAEVLAIVNILTGWPATILLLALSYLYGQWRLQNLKGPSVEEFRAGAAPPWIGQRRGF